MRIHPVAGFLFVCLAVSTAWAQPLGTAFTYQGRLKNGGSPANGSFNMNFKLYSVASGGTQLASQTLPSVAVSDGLFTVPLDFGAGVFDGNQRWLDVTVNGAPLLPRQELKAVPYAQLALNADKLDGLNSTAFLTGVPNPLSITGTSNNHIIQGHNLSAVNGASGVFGSASAASGQIYGVHGHSASTNGFGVFGVATSVTGPSRGGFFESASTQGIGVLGLAKATTGSGAIGVYGQSDSPSGYGVYSNGKMHATGVISGNASGLTNFPVPFSLAGSGAHVFSAQNTSPDSGVAVLGLATAGTGGTIGGRFESASDEGIGVLGLATTTMANGYTSGVHGQAASSIGRGVFGRATSASGENYGVWGESDSNTGTGVYGKASNSIGVSYGVRGVSLSSTGTGVKGDAVRTGVEGFANSPTGFGVFGHATSTSGVNIGVYGATSSPSGWGILSFGNMGGNGTKSFRIDHPIDPENKYLLHYSTESPVPQNFYVGNVTTDGRGYAWVELPDYFSEINVNFKYQLTIVDDADSNAFVQAKVSKKIRDNRFQVRTNAPNVEVSWRVDADRNDLYVRNRPPKDFEEKEGQEKGKYQYPEFYGQPPEKGVNYEAMSRRSDAELSASPIPAELETSTAAETTPQ